MGDVEMVRELILVKASAKDVTKFIDEACNIEGVTDAYAVFGRFDAVVFIRGKDFDELKAVARKVLAIRGIKHTETLPETD